VASVSAILLDAGGVMLFPDPELVLPPLRAAGVSPSLADLERAHYWAMAAGDHPARPVPQPGTWWAEYLGDYVAACGVPDAKVTPLAEEMSRTIRGFAWTHVGSGVSDGLRELAALGLPVGVVSNANGEVEAALGKLDVCFVPDGQIQGCAGIAVGVIIDSAVVGIAKPEPGIFHLALAALGLPADGTVLHVGDSLRYDVAGALAAGVRPVHLDPHGYCPAPAGHDHIRRLTDLLPLLQESAAADHELRARSRATSPVTSSGYTDSRSRCIVSLGRWKGRVE
jgi:putative hydrolase of the HAD superfamily